MKRSHLRWFIPIVLYFIVVVIILGVYKGIIYNRAAIAKLTEIALAVGEEVRDRDIELCEAISAVSMSGRAMSLYNIGYNDNQIKSLLNYLVDETELTDVLVCDAEGRGYDYLGKDISIGEKTYFPSIVSEYSKGGTGMVLPDGDESARNTACLMVTGVRFANRDSGYLVGSVPVETISDRLFREHYIMDKVAIVTINGNILVDGKGGRPDDFSESASFWEQLPPGISKETIKLSISQKNVYMGKVEDYGYVIVSPYCSAGGGAVVLIRESAMETMVKDSMDTYNSEAIRLIVASAFLIVLVIITYYLSDLIEKAMKKKKYAAHDLDELTGLLSKQSAIVEIKSYSEPGDNKKGLLFMLELGDFSETRDQKGEAFADEKIKEFANSLFGRYRATDVVARYSDDRFLVFLKGISDQKDIRKQTDEMQLFLHDSRFFDADREITVNAGAAVYPDNGRNAPDIINAAERALERSKSIGKGILSF